MFTFKTIKKREGFYFGTFQNCSWGSNSKHLNTERFEGPFSNGKTLGS